MRSGRVGCWNSFFLDRSKFHKTKVGSIFVSVLFVVACLSASATVNGVFVQAPDMAQGATSDLISPVHFQATAESDLNITGYVIYVDGQNAFQNFIPLLDTWVVLAPGKHSVYLKAWDSSGSLASTATYAVNVTGFAPPSPPSNAIRITHIARKAAQWTADNNPDVGGVCQNGEIVPFESNSDPNTANSPDSPKAGMHFRLTSECQYDDSLFYFKATQNPAALAATNLMWDFWFYLPTTSRAGSIQALEFDLFQALPLNDGVHEFMFGSQCNYISNEWQLWLPQGGGLTWVNTGVSPCRFSTGAWHHATYFLQRVTPGGFPQLAASLNAETDTNSSLRFGTLTIDGHTSYLGAQSYSKIPSPAWSEVLGVQHQLDSAMAGITIDEYVDMESVIAW